MESTSLPRRQELATRVERLERENRRIKLAGIAVITGLAALFLAGAMTRTGAKTLEAERIRIVDSSGHLGVEIVGSTLSMIGHADAAGTQVRSTLRPPGLDVQVKRGEKTIRVLEVNSKEIDLIDYLDEKRAVLTPRVIGLQNGIAGTSTPEIAWITMRETGFRFEDRRGTPRIEIGKASPEAMPDARPRERADLSPTIVVYSADGSVAWQAPQ